MRNRSLVLLAGLLSALVLSSGCDKKERATQVAAKVNGYEITVHRINYVLAQSQNITPEAAPQAKRDILDKLIDQHLARQKAVENRLDRSPNVVQAIEAAQSEILARAYLEQLVAGLPKTEPWEIQKYYAEHPELFAKRRLFDLEEFEFVADGDVIAKLRAWSSNARSMQDIADWLQSRGIKLVANRHVRPAEQITLEILPMLQSMQEGEIRLFDLGGGRFQVIRVAAFKTDPLDEATAAPLIRQFLLTRRSREYIAKEMKQLKELAKIEYFGEFADGAAETQEKVGPEADANAKSLGESKVRPAVEPQPGSEESPKNGSQN